MEILTILFLVFVLITTVAYIFRPVQENTQYGRVNNPARMLLLEEKDRLLALLRELDFDYQLGKVPEDEYINQRIYFLNLGASVLKGLDALHTGASNVTDPLSSIEDRAITDNDIEDYIQKRRLKRSHKT